MGNFGVSFIFFRFLVVAQSQFEVSRLDTGLGQISTRPTDHIWALLFISFINLKPIFGVILIQLYVLSKNNRVNGLFLEYFWRYHIGKMGSRDILTPAPKVKIQYLDIQNFFTFLKIDLWMILMYIMEHIHHSQFFLAVIINYF